MSHFLDQENRLSLIASDLAEAEFMRGNNATMLPYVMQSKRNDLAGIDFTGGISTEERMSVGREMQAYQERTASRIADMNKQRFEQFQQHVEATPPSP